MLAASTKPASDSLITFLATLESRKFRGSSPLASLIQEPPLPAALLPPFLRAALLLPALALLPRCSSSSSLESQSRFS